jgi:photosynthetic reaction center cytochrome c subunit
MISTKNFLASALLLGITCLIVGCERPPQASQQTGFRGTGMVEIDNPRIKAKVTNVNALPEATPKADAGGPTAGSLYKNVQVLGNQSVGEFTRTMVAMTNWVAPNEGCNYCHKAGEDFSADTLYTKVVARKMLSMTGKINADWGTHVGNTGVTCYTCHRGNNVPTQVWNSAPDPGIVKGFTGWKYGQNMPVSANGYSSLPLDSLSSYLSGDGQVRIQGATALPVGVKGPTGTGASIPNTEWNYSLMIHMSDSLGVNCTFCHNSRAFAEWKESTPQRATAWHGLRMVRDINNGYLTPLESIFPANRKGPLGDVAKVGCSTCHQGVNKPLLGVSMLADYPELKKISSPDATAAPPAAGAAPVSPIASALNVLGKIFFASGKADIDAAGSDAVKTAAKALTANTAAKLEISGFADSTGNQDQNLELAKQRAFAVRDALKAAGVAEARISLKKPEFIVGSATPDSRRVDLIGIGL